MYEAIVDDGNGNPSSHENMAVRVVQGPRTWFESNTLHEHDAIGAFATGLPGAHYLVVDADGESVTAETDHPEWISGLRAWEPNFRDSGRTISVDANAFVESIARGSEGVWIRSWLFVNERPTEWISTINVEEKIDVEHRLLGNVFIDDFDSGAPAPANKQPTSNPPISCGDNEITLDPETVHLGNPVRVTVSGETGQMTYRLLRDVATAPPEAPADPLPQEMLIMEWQSHGPSGLTSFRVPSADLFRLQIKDSSHDCEILIDATGDLGRTVEVATGQVSSFEQMDDDLVFSLDIEGNGHYEHPASVTYQNESTSFLIWSGKLHSHGGLSSFTIPDPQPGEYVVRWDTGAQGPDPIVPNVSEMRYTVTAQAESQESPAPLGILALLLVALIARRRD
jgi:hypothetical protein